MPELATNLVYEFWFAGLIFGAIGVGVGGAIGYFIFKAACSF